jgi:hypothetical protein
MAIMSRWRAASIHLAISAAIAGAVLGVMLVVWYPQPFFEAAGGSHLLLILVGVDVVLGPTITLVIFDLKKKPLRALKFDLMVIATLQLAAMLYGVSVVFNARPVYVVFVKERFELVTAAEIDPAELAKVTQAEFRDLPLTGPRVIGAVPPTDADERERVLLTSVFGSTDLQVFPQYYVPYEKIAAEVAAKGLTLTKAREIEPAAAAAVESYINRSGLREMDVRYLPLHSRRAWLAAVVDAKTGAILAFLPVADSN